MGGGFLLGREGILSSGATGARYPGGGFLPGNSGNWPSGALQ